MSPAVSPERGGRVVSCGGVLRKRSCCSNWSSLSICANSEVRVMFTILQARLQTNLSSCYLGEVERRNSWSERKDKSVHFSMNAALPQQTSTATSRQENVLHFNFKSVGLFKVDRCIDDETALSLIRTLVQQQQVHEADRHIVTGVFALFNDFAQSKLAQSWEISPVLLNYTRFMLERRPPVTGNRTCWTRVVVSGGD